MPARNIHRKASKINKTNTIFSSCFGLPIALYSFLKSVTWIFSQPPFGRYIRKIRTHADRNNNIVTGTAKINQSANEISFISGKIILTIRTNERLGGVPTNVAIPPIDAEYAIPSNNPTEYFPIFCCPRLSSSFKMIDNAMGTIIMAVAVFDIHMESNDVASIKPSKILPGLIPNEIKILSAIRR